MTYDWEPYKDICYRVYVEEKQSLRKLHAYLKNNHNFDPSLRGLHHRLQQWNFPAKHNPAYKNVALVARIKELWETNHTVRDMVSLLTEEGFEVQERDVNRIRQKNRWLLRADGREPNSKKDQKKRPATQATSPDDILEDSDDSPSSGEEDQDSAATPIFDPVTPSAALADLDFTQAQAEAFQEARKRTLAIDAEEKRLTKKRRRWLKGRAGLPADPPGPPRFPSELSLTECKAVLAMDPAIYRDVRAKFRRICEAEGVVKKTIAGPHKWEAIKLQLVRESMHLRGVFWDQLNMDQKNLALDLICGDVTKGMRSEGSRMMMHEARNILGLNPKMGREVRLHFQRILAGDHFKGKVVAGEEHWSDLVQRWLAESEVLGPVATSLNVLDPEYAQKKKAIEVVARDAMKRFRDAEVRGTLQRMLAQGQGGAENDGEDDQLDAHGETDHEAAGGDTTVMDAPGFEHGAFDADEDALIAAQLSGATTNQAAGQGQPAGDAASADIQGQPETPAPVKRKRGRPRKHPYPDPQPEGSEPPPPKKRGRQSRRIPEEEALAIYAHSQARFMPPSTTSGQGASSVPVDPELTGSSATSSQGVGAPPQYMPTSTPAPVPAAVESPSFFTPDQVRAQLRAQAQAQAQTQARARAQIQAQAQGQSQGQSSTLPLASATAQGSTTQVPTPAAAPTQAYRAPTAIYFRLHPASTVTGLPSMWVATLASRSIEELRFKAVSKRPGANCAVVDGIVKDGVGGEIPLPISGNTELEAYLDHMHEIHGPPTFSVQLMATG